MPTLTDEMKRFVVRCKAYYADDKDIIKSMIEIYGDAAQGLTKQNLEIYDPMSAAFRLRLGDELKAYFLECRKEADADEAHVPLASRFYRLLRLQQIIDNEMIRENPVMVTKVLEQAAKEMGGQYNAAAAKPPAGGAISGGTSGAGSADADRAEELNSLLDTLRARKDRDAPGEGVSGSESERGSEKPDP